jgi:hypothetical protein
LRDCASFEVKIVFSDAILIEEFAVVPGPLEEVMTDAVSDSQESHPIHGMNLLF